MDADYRLASFGCRLLFTAFAATPKIRGRQHLEGVEPPYIVACNHASLIDPALMIGYFPEPIRFLAKVELETAPWIGFIEGRLGNIHLRRDGRDVGPIRQALKMLKSDTRCLVVFVEGTRTSTESDLDQFKDGAAVLAARSQVPVIPVYLENTGLAAPPGTIVPTWYPLTLRIGPPVDLSGLSPRPDAAEVERASEAIRQAILGLRSPAAA